MKALLWTISRDSQVHSDAFEDLAIVLEQALSMVPVEAPRCQFCQKAREVIR